MPGESEDIGELLERYSKGEVMTTHELNRLHNWIAGIQPKIGFGPSARELDRMGWKIWAEIRAREGNSGK